MTFVNVVRRWGDRQEPAVRPLPARVNADTQRRSAPTPTCGAIDHLSGAVCTLAPHTGRLHRDNTDRSTAVEWWDDGWTAHRGKAWTPPTLRLIGENK